MAILDYTQSFPGVAGFLAAVDNTTTELFSSIAIDLNPDFGTGVNARKSPIIGQSGEDWVMVCTVVLAFTVGAGTPLAAVHLVVGDGTPGAGLNLVGGNNIIIGSSVGSFQFLGGPNRFPLGFTAAQLPLGAQFYIRPNPYAQILGRSNAGAVIAPRNLRSFAVVLQQVAGFERPMTSKFGQGAIECYTAKCSDIANNPKDFIYPAGHSVV